MSIASPQNRSELKEYIKTKLGAPVLQVNVSDEQMDLAINDAFQYFYERQHFDGIERVFLSVKVSDELQAFFKTGEIHRTDQSTNQPVSADGMVETLTLVNPGSGYPLTTNSEGDLIDTKMTGGSGKGLTVTPTTARTTSGGILEVGIYDCGKGYQIGDQITLKGGDDNCVFEVTALRTEPSPLYGVEDIKEQNNFIILPDNVIGVSRIIKPRKYMGMGGLGGMPIVMPMMFGGMMGMGGMGMHFDMTSYYSMQQYLATMEFLLMPPLSFYFNQRTHRLHIESDNFNGVRKGEYLVFECDVKADPDLFPDVYNDMFLKRLSVAYVQLAWGRVLTKYQQVQLPGGITMNGDQIYNDAKAEISQIEERFAMDYAMPPLDIVG